MTDILDHAGLKALAKELGRPLFTLEVTLRDPFTAGVPARRAAAEWFGELWQRFDVQPGAHLRRIHYLLVVQAAGAVLMPDGSPYLNLDRPCFDLINTASLDARHLGLVPAADLVDRRNDEPVIYLPAYASDAELTIAGGLGVNELSGFTIPALDLTPPKILQRYHVEIWCEKTTMNDVLLPLCQRYGINLITGSGELSLTACVNVVKRALASGRPVRILYLSDFDPAGASMPVAVARKIEHVLHTGRHDLNIQVRPIVLTLDQCERYRLPRKPIKDTERRAEVFEARFGEGATELDALEALHPGELARILRQEIGRYYDTGLGRRLVETVAEVQTDLDEINTKVRKRHAKALRALQSERKKALAALATFEKKAEPVLRKIERDLDAEAPDVDTYDWPEPAEGDEDPDPLFDSTRGYVEQIDRYKLHQGKPTKVEPRRLLDPITVTCANCGKKFSTTGRTAKTCGQRCRNQLHYKRSQEFNR